MTRIRLGAALLLAAAGLLGLAAAELEFYRDVEPKFASAESLKRLARFLESKRLHHQSLGHHHQQQQEEQLEELQELHRKQQRSHQQHLLELAMQKQRGLLRDDLPERPNILEMLQRQDADPLEYVRELERQRLLPYLEYQAAPRIKPYSVEDEVRARLMPSHLIKDPMLDYPETHYAGAMERTRQMEENARRIEESYMRKPEFTYSFPKPDHQAENEQHPFAVGPNDRRYYFKDEPAEKDSEDQREHEDAKEAPAWDEPQEPVERKVKKPSTPKPQQEVVKFHPTNEETPFAKTRFVEVSVLPEPQRRAEQDPLAVTISRKDNNDVYFIAIVAGCSAVAMFALVLISLTWCRLQRVSKAAADVEYPAYGVTGPNKDISPSGDQRLAQSAQMYHFQHQKQQIIAMEKQSATRDPGSVSEAESDEENEEGDYTVYECPGLAPTGEMEVKNPLFHDDPTPASPSKSKKNGDDRDV